MKRGNSMPSTMSFATTTIVLLGMPAVLHAQEKPEESEQSAEQQMLGDFGSGLRALAWALDDPDLDLKELWLAASDSVLPEQGDLGMDLYVEEYETNQQQEELLGFREELVNSVTSGAMSRDEALTAWVEIMDVRFFHNFKDSSNTEWAERLEDLQGRGYVSSITLRVPDAGDVRVLTRPEFLRRDLQYFSRELELDESSRSIIKILIEDYVRAYEARSKALEDAIRSARRGMARQWARDRVASAQANIDDLVETVDWNVIRERVGDEIEEGERQEWMYSALDRFQGSVADIQRAIDRRQQDLALDVAPETDSMQVLQMAENLQRDRPRLRRELIESMRLVLDEQQQLELERIFDRFILEQARNDSKLGGTGINLEDAMERAFEGDVDDRPRMMLEESTPELLQLVDRWTNARLDRERSGLELFMAYQSEDDSSTRGLTRAHAQRATTELEAALAIRDRLIAGQVELEAVIAGVDPETAVRFAAITREQGFAPQLRLRWGERAIAAAVACADLDAEREDALKAYGSAVSGQLEPLRMQAIQERLMMEPRIARAKIDKMTNDGARQSLNLAAWQEPGSARFRAIDEQVKEQLASMLSASECSESIPQRRGASFLARRAANAEAAKADDKKGADTNNGATKGEGRRGRVRGSGN